MTILEYQRELAKAVSEDEWLRRFGVEAFAEDDGDLYGNLSRALAERGGLAAVVLTPDARNLGNAPSGAIAADLDPVEIRFIEIPALNRQTPGRPTALDAALHLGLDWHCRQMHFRRVRQEAGETADGAEALCAVAEFHASIDLSDPAASGGTQQQGE